LPSQNILDVTTYDSSYVKGARSPSRRVIADFFNDRENVMTVLYCDDEMTTNQQNDLQISKSVDANFLQTAN